MPRRPVWSASYWQRNGQGETQPTSPPWNASDRHFGATVRNCVSYRHLAAGFLKSLCLKNPAYNLVAGSVLGTGSVGPPQLATHEPHDVAHNVMMDAPDRLVSILLENSVMTAGGLLDQSEGARLTVGKRFRRVVLMSSS